MNRAASSVSLALAGVLALVFGGFGFLIYGVAGDRTGLRILPTDDVRLEVLSDPSLRLSLQDVLAQPASAWPPHTGDYYIQAFHGGAVWVRATFTNSTGRPVRGVLADDELIVDRLDCWTPDPAEPDGWLHQISGETIPGRIKPIRGRETAVYITVPAHGKTVAYLRAKDHFNTWFRAVWWPEASAFLSAQLRHTLAETLYFGVLVALLIYNLVLWVRLRHRDLGYYLGYLGSMAVFMAFSRAQPQLLGMPLGSPILEPLVTTALASTGFFLVQFAREFFGLRAISPRLDRVARTLGWLNLGFALGSPTLLWSQTSLWMHIVIPGMVVTHTTLLVMAVLAWRLGVRQARFFLLSFGVFLFGGTPFVYHWMRAIPLGDTALPLMIGSALEMLLLSLAVADRFARISQDRHTAQLAEEKARLESLRYQLNPHFLFNALNSIYGLVYPHSASHPPRRKVAAARRRARHAAQLPRYRTGALVRPARARVRSRSWRRCVSAAAVPAAPTRGQRHQARRRHQSRRPHRAARHPPRSRWRCDARHYQQRHLGRARSPETPRRELHRSGSGEHPRAPRTRLPLRP
jgi:hypothetical protein